MSGDTAITSESDLTVASAADGCSGEVVESVHLEPGEWVAGRYQVESFLGRGGYAEVYRVTDTQAEGRSVALKLHRWGRLSRRAISALRSEFGLLSTLTHPNLAAVYDFAYRPSEYAFFTQALIDGVELSPETVDPTSPAGGVLLVQLCRALDYLHSRGVLHGDIKPGNILVDREAGHLTLLDFGISRSVGGGSEGLVAGSPPYMAPELITGGGVDARADLYALGVTLYQLVTGAVPFRGSRRDILAQHLDAPAPDLRHDLPLALRVLIARLLAKDPNDRPASAALVLADLARVAGVPAEVDTQETLVSHLLSAPAVGRVGELFELSGRVAHSGPSRAPVLLTGEAGAGKSRLIRELRRRVQLRGEGWIQVGVRRGRDDVILRLARAVLDRVRREQLDEEARIELARALPELRRQGEWIAVPIDPVRAWRRRLERLGEVISVRFVDQPGVLVVEDLHWATEHELELLVALIRSARDAGARCLFLLVARPERAEELAEAFDAEPMACGPLSPRAANALIEATLGDAQVLAGSGLGARIDAAPSGPLWLQESLRLAIEVGALVRRGGRFERVADIEAAPLADVLAARLERVGGTARRLALGLAVLDEPHLARDLVRASGLRRASALEALAELVRTGIVERLTDGPHAHYAMHERYSQRLLELEPARSVSATRGRVGRWLARHSDAEFRDLARAATELCAAGDTPAAVAALSRAADLAEQSSRPEHAVALLRREFAMRLPHDPARVGLLIRVYDLAARCGLHEQASEALERLTEAVAATADPELSVKVGLRRAHRAYREGDLERAREVCERAFHDAVDGSHDVVACELAILSANIQLRLGALDRSLARSVDAVERAKRLGRADLEANAQIVSGLVHVHRRDVGDSNEAARRAVRAADRTDDPVLRSRTLRLLGNAHVVAGRRKLALYSYRRAVREARRSGGIEPEAKALNNLAAVASSVGQIAEALEAWERAIVLKERVGAAASAMVTRASMGGVQLLFGDRAEARAEQQRILDTTRLDARLAIAVAWSNRGDLEAFDGNFGSSVEAYDRSVGGYLGLQMSSLRAHGLCGGIRSRLARGEAGDLEEAGAMLLELEEISRVTGTPAHQRFASTTRAVYLDACGEPGRALEVAVAAARITHGDTVYEDVFASPVEAAWIVAVIRRRLGRPTQRAVARAQRRLERSAARLDPALRAPFLSQHPLHVAIRSGDPSSRPGTSW